MTVWSLEKLVLISLYKFQKPAAIPINKNRKVSLFPVPNFPSRYLPMKRLPNIDTTMAMPMLAAYAIWI